MTKEYCWKYSDDQAWRCRSSFDKVFIEALQASRLRPDIEVLVDQVTPRQKRIYKISSGEIFLLDSK